MYFSYVRLRRSYYSRNIWYTWIFDLLLVPDVSRHDVTGLAGHRNTRGYDTMLQYFILAVHIFNLNLII